MPLDSLSTFAPADEVFELLYSGQIDTSLPSLRKKLNLCKTLEDYVRVYEYLIEHIPISPGKTKFLKAVRVRLYKLYGKKSIDASLPIVFIGGEEYRLEVKTTIENMRAYCANLLDYLEKKNESKNFKKAA